MPYVVTIGTLHYKRKVYGTGESVPALKGELSAQAEIGVVEWQDSRVKPEPEPAPKPRARKTRKAVKP